MSAFTDCIRTAIDAGSVSAEKGARAIQAYEDKIAEGMAEGLSEQAARDAATSRSIEELTQATAAKKWQRINEIRKAHVLTERLTKAKDIPDELIKLGDEIDIASERIRGLAHARITDFIERSRPRAAGMHYPVSHLNDIVDAAYGANVRNSAAKEMADSIKDVMEFLSKLANREGASIPEQPNWRLPQSHSALKVRKIRATVEESKQLWVQDHMERLDWNIMRYEGKPIPVNRRAEILGRTFDAIESEGDIRIVPGQRRVQGSTATRMHQERFLYYKDANAWKEMNEKYGEGNLFQQTIGMIESMSRDIASLEHLGPNPHGMNHYLRNLVMKRAAESGRTGSSKKKSQRARVDKAFSDYQARFDLHSRNLPNSDESLLAAAGGNLRTFTMGSLLSGAYIANLGDIGAMKYAAHYYNLPMTGHIRSYVNQFVPNKQNRIHATRSGLIAESATSMALSLQRVYGPLEGGAWAKRYSDVVLRAGLLTPHTQAAKWAWQNELLGHFYDMRGKRFEELPFVQHLREYGISERDWDIFRTSKAHEEGGWNQLRPIDLHNTGDPEAMRVAERFTDFVLQTMRRAVPSADSRAQVSLGAVSDPRTWRGQLLKSFGALKSFPVTIMMVHLRDGMMQETWGKALKHIGMFGLYLTMGGALITQMKELSKGNDPLDMTKPQFWAKAALNGGSFGFLGDAIFNNLNARSGGLSQSVAGPMVDFLDQMRDITLGNVQELLEGKDTNLPKEVVETVMRYGPWVWMAKLAVQRTIADELLKQSDPAAYRRMRMQQKRMERENNQGRWWGTGEKPRAPNFGAALGQ